MPSILEADFFIYDVNGDFLDLPDLTLFINDDESRSSVDEEWKVALELMKET